MSRVKLATVPVGMSTAVPTAMPAATGPTPGLPPTTAPATGPAPGLSTAAVQKATRSLGNRELALAAVFSSHMVLQRRAPIAVFGTGKPGSTVTVTLAAHGAMSIIQVDGTSVDQISVSCTIADTGITSTDITSTGVWHLSLPPVERAAPCTLTVTDRRGNALTLDDVLVGEVWVAAGQSNMEYILLNDAEAEQTIAGSDDARLRFVNIAKSGVVDDALLQAERESSWQVCSPQSSANMSAVAYYCAAMLRRRLEGDVPVGIVDCYVGGTSVSCWMSEHTLSSSEAGRGYLDRYHAAVAGKSAEQMHRDMDAWSAAFNAWNDAIARARVERPGIGWQELNAQYGECPWPPPMTTFSQYHPTGPYQAMVSRLAPYTVRGVLWYQGEEDTAYGDSYRTMLNAMIADWRALWKTPELPFIIVQLPRWISRDDAFAHHDDRSWATVRQAQRDVATAANHVWLSVCLDLGEFDNIHPTVKRPFGERLAATALAGVYGATGIEADGPQYNDVERLEGTNRIRVRFAHAEHLHFGHYNGDAQGTTISIPPGAPYAEPMRIDAQNSGFELLTHHRDGAPAAAAAWVRVPAVIHHDEVQLEGPEQDCVTAVRYGWSNWGPAPLFNAANLPAEPFQITAPPVQTKTASPHH